jgi:hypothetical protein
MENPDFKSNVPERESTAAIFVVAAIIFVIVFAAINAQSIVHEIRIALF